MFQADSAKAEDKRDKIAANLDKLRNHKKTFEELYKKWPQFAS
jgi:hypothetical protein